MSEQPDSSATASSTGSGAAHSEVSPIATSTTSATERGDQHGSHGEHPRHVPAPRTAEQSQRQRESELAEDLLHTLRSAQVDTSWLRGDLGRTTGWYTALLVTLLTGVGLWAFFEGTSSQLGATHFTADVGFLAFGLRCAALGVIVLVSRGLGPLGATRAMRTWLLSTPADRATLVRGSVSTVAALAGAFAGISNGFAAAVTGHEHVHIFVDVLLGFAVGVFVVTVMAAVQYRPNAESATFVAGYGLLSIAALSLTLSVLPGWSSVAQLVIPTEAQRLWALWRDLILTMLFVALTWRLSAQVKRSARHLTVHQLARGGDVWDALSISTLMLDSTPLRAAVTPRVKRRIDNAPLTRRGVAALAEMDLRRINRFGVGKLIVATAVPLPAAASAIFGAVGGWAVTLLVSFVIAHNLADGLATYQASSSIQRDLPYPVPHARAALLIGPVGAAALYAVPAMLLARVDLFTWPILVLAVAASLLRKARPRDTSVATSGMISTPMGVIPLGILRLLSRGYDFLVLPGFAVAVGLPSVGFLTAALPLAVYLLRRD